MEPLALDRPGGPPVTIYETHAFGPHPGFSSSLTVHPAWAPSAPILSDNTGYSAPALSVQVFENATLARRAGIAFDRNNLLIAETTSAQRWIDPHLREVPDLVISGAGRVEPDLSHVPSVLISRDTHGALSATGQTSVTDIDQPVLYTNYGGYTVFGHYIFETLTSLWAMRASMAAGSVKILMPYSSATWPHHLLDVLGLDASARFQVNAANLSCRTLAVASSCSGLQTFYPMPRMREMVDVLKARCGATPGKLRFYITRQGAGTTSGRFVENEVELFEGLKTLGFIAIEPSRCTFDQQVRIFNQAEAIVGMHGSAFANAVFAEPGTLVVDLLPDYLATSVGRWIKNITHAFDQRYFYVICRSRPVPQGHAVRIDVPLVLERLAKALKGDGF